jgi:hypothetical protein
MLYLLQVNILVAIAILLPLFIVYLASTLLRLGYLAAIRLVHLVTARRLTRLEAAGGVMGDARNAATRPMEVVVVTKTRRRFEPALAESRTAAFDTVRRSTHRVA